MHSRDVTRRTVLTATGAVSVTAIAGCLGLGAGADHGVFDDATFVDDEPEYDGWLDDAVTHEGTVDWAGEDEVTVLVGTGENGMGFGPAAIQVDAGTTVVWEWTGEGGVHDVVHVDGEFASEGKLNLGETFAHTFDEPGTYLYSCLPHERRGMKGAVDVV